MISKYLIFGGLFFSLSLISCAEETQREKQTTEPDSPKTSISENTSSKKQSVDLALQKALWQEIESNRETQGLEPQAQKLLVDYIDLNGDTQQDAVVILIGSYWCGTGGCTMKIFERQAQQFRLVSSSSLIRPPLRVSDTKTNGWRDLIVEVSGGGATPKTVALKFDGEGYPLNPSVQPSISEQMASKGTVLFPEGTEPQVMSEIAGSPSFDCSKAQGEVETLICQEEKLATLDRKLDRVYQTALKKAEEFPSQELDDFRSEQRAWIESRNNCSPGQETTIRDCVEAHYQERLAELQAQFALVSAQNPVFFTCNSNPANEIVATYYETEPPTARLERGDTVITVFLRPSESGRKYKGQNVMFWSKGKEAIVEWNGETLQCQTR